MASDHTFDIVSQYNQQELVNALDQVRRETTTRYDFKGSHIEVTLNDEDITLIAPDSMKLEALKGVLLQKIINRKLSSKILDFQEPEPASGGALRQVVKLVKVLDQKQCKDISNQIRENFPKVKANIQGETVRVVSKNIDDLQAVIAHFRGKEDLPMPLDFINFR